MKYIKKTLENGLRIILVPMQDNETVTVMLLAETGSEYENKAQNGISHFLEHMCFKGTVKRPKSSMISRELDGLGSASNAFTNTDHTGYYAKAHHKHVSNILDIISDLYLNSTFPEEEITKEKGVVIEEINMYEDMPQNKVWNILDEALYGEQPAGKTIIGTKETVNAITRDDLVKYKSEHYVPGKTVLVVSGKIDVENILPEIENIFAHIPEAPIITKERVVELQEAPVIKMETKVSDQTHLVMAFRTFDLFDDRIYTAGTLSAVLGKGMSSRLFQTIREDLGLAYYISASHNPSLDHGVFTISAGVSNENVEKAVSAILAELVKIKNELVGEEELKKVKDFRAGHLYLGLESSDAWGEFYGFQEIYHEDIMTPEDILKRREMVTAQDINYLAKDIFRANNFTLALVGPAQDAVVFENLVKVLE